MHFTYNVLSTIWYFIRKEKSKLNRLKYFHAHILFIHLNLFFKLTLKNTKGKNIYFGIFIKKTPTWQFYFILSINKWYINNKAFGYFNPFTYKIISSSITKQTSIYSFSYQKYFHLSVNFHKGYKYYSIHIDKVSTLKVFFYSFIINISKL